jgi:hypothetical protein
MANYKQKSDNKMIKIKIKKTNKELAKPNAIKLIQDRLFYPEAVRRRSRKRYWRQMANYKQK